MSLRFTGGATVAEYQSLLLSLTYVNFESEPTSGNRSISISISDGIHQDMTAVIIIIILSNDNPLIILSANDRLEYSEGDVAIAVGMFSGIILVDDDGEAVVENLTLTLINSLESDKEFLVVDNSTLYPQGGGGLISGASVVLTRPSSLQNYQVRA